MVCFFAKIENNNTVSEIVDLRDDRLSGKSFPETESIGRQILFAKGKTGTWVQAFEPPKTESFIRVDPAAGIPCTIEGDEDPKNGLRGHFPSEGYIYDQTLDKFLPPKPYKSWILDTDTLTWKCPVSYPADGGGDYVWNEAKKLWVEAERTMPQDYYEGALTEEPNYEVE